MGARTGHDYITGLKDDRTVWLDGRRVDVVDEPRFAGSLRGMAEYFDYQHDHADDCLVQDDETGEMINASHIIPLDDDAMRRRHRALDRLARYSIGMLGRTPDYVNVTVAGFVAQRSLFEKNGDTRAGAALAAFQRDVALRDLSLTHTIINPVIDKAVNDVEGINAELTPRIVRRTDDGIVVSGSKILGTLGPFADENFVYPAHPLPKDADPAYALCFSVPVGAKGLHTVCRDHYTVDGTRADHPFSSRFDEQDAFLIFDEVEVPWERVFIAGDLDVYGNVMKHGWAANIIQQTAIRAAVKLEFAYDLAFKMVEVQNMGARAEATQLLGELVTYADMTRAGDPCRRGRRSPVPVRRLVLRWRTVHRAARPDAIVDDPGQRHLQDVGQSQPAVHAERGGVRRPGARTAGAQVPAGRQRHRRRGASQDLPDGVGLRRLGPRVAQRVVRTVLPVQPAAQHEPATT